MGYALFLAQYGDKYVAARPLRGYGGAGVLEVVDDHEGNAYRLVYTVRYSDAVYVLHAFQKKSTHGIATGRRDVDLISARLELARGLHEQRTSTTKGATR